VPETLTPPLAVTVILHVDLPESLIPPFDFIVVLHIDLPEILTPPDIDLPDVMTPPLDKMVVSTNTTDKPEMLGIFYLCLMFFFVFNI
jgi:hypothetical protein